MLPLRAETNAGSGALLWRLFFFNDTATTEIYTLSLHDALPICPSESRRADAFSVVEIASPEALRGLRRALRVIGIATISTPVAGSSRLPSSPLKKDRDWSTTSSPPQPTR